MNTISMQSKVILIIAIPFIILSQMIQFNLYSLVLNSITFGFIAYNANCLVYGNCEIWAWISILFPIIVSLLITYIFINVLNVKSVRHNKTTKQH
jgi:hypothetical protein